MKTDTPLACNMNVFTPVQRENHIQTTIQLMQGLQSIEELDNGYKFIFPNKTELITKIAEFISNERLCCPFLEFDLNIISNSETISLSLVGPAGTQEFLRAEFSGAFQ
jgi:hypothetical protein